MEGALRGFEISVCNQSYDSFWRNIEVLCKLFLTSDKRASFGAIHSSKSRVCDIEVEMRGLNHRKRLLLNFFDVTRPRTTPFRRACAPDHCDKIRISLKARFHSFFPSCKHIHTVSILR